MKQHYPAAIEPQQSNLTESLTDRLDPSIGEATTVMGAMLTELLRRTLRGGVARIGEELNGYVTEKVDATIAERTPAIEQAAAEVAENAARVAATEVVHEEVSSLERRTKEARQSLALQIEEQARLSKETTEGTARDLTSRIELAEKKAELTHASSVRELVQQIEQAEKRVGEQSHARMTLHVDEIMERSRKGTAQLKARMQTLEEAAKALEHQTLAHFKSQEERHRRALENGLEETQAQLRAELAVLLEANEALKVRIIELERPRGLRGLWHKLFGRKKKPIH